MKTYLITGGAGFIGSTLADKLLDMGFKVVVIDNFNDYYDVAIKENNVKPNLSNPNYQLYRGDIRDIELMENIFANHSFDCVIHLAACAGVRPSIENPLLYQDVNGNGSLILFEMMKKYNVKNCAFASSSSVYGNNKTVPFKETDVVDFAISPYAATKKANEVMGHVYHALYDINMAFMRFFTVYGPRQRPDLAINKFTRLILNDEEIPVYGDGSTSRDYTYIDDIVDGIIRVINFLLENDKVYEIFNLGNSNPITLREMIEGIELALNKKALMKHLPMQPGDVDRTYADITKAHTMLGYTPKTSYQDGVKKFVDWYLANEEHKKNE